MNQKRIRRLMHLMLIYQKPNTSKPAKGHKTYPRSPSELWVEQPNEDRSRQHRLAADAPRLSLPGRHHGLAHPKGAGLTHLQHARGRLSRVEALNEAGHRFGQPGIMDADQGSQFTSFAWNDRLKRIDTRILMDGKGRCLDNPRSVARTSGAPALDHRTPMAVPDIRVRSSARFGNRFAGQGRHWQMDRLLQPPAASCRPWQTAAHPGPRQPDRNRPAGAGSSLNHPRSCPTDGK